MNSKTSNVCLGSKRVHNQPLPGYQCTLCKEGISCGRVEERVRETVLFRQISAVGENLKTECVAKAQTQQFIY